MAQAKTPISPLTPMKQSTITPKTTTTAMKSPIGGTKIAAAAPKTTSTTQPPPKTSAIAPIASAKKSSIDPIQQSSSAKSKGAPPPGPKAEAVEATTGAGDGERPQQSDDEKEDDPYEKVIPKGAAMQGTEWSGYGDDWQPVGQRWWGKKARKQKMTAACQLCISFTILVALLLVMFVVGIVALVAWHGSKSGDITTSTTPRVEEQEAATTEAAEPPDFIVKTKTELCRADKQYSNWSKCIYETAHNDDDVHNSCNNDDDMCTLDMWKMESDGGVINFRRDLIYFRVANVEHAECALDQHRCVNGECVKYLDSDSETSWPITFDVGQIEDARMSPVDPSNLACLEKPGDDLKIAFNELKNFTQCKSPTAEKMCSTFLAKWEFAVVFMECDLSVEDEEIGKRKRCPASEDDLPPTMFKVRKCDNVRCHFIEARWQEEHDKAIQIPKCSSGSSAQSGNGGCHYHCKDEPGSEKHLMFDGMHCSLGADGVCLKGRCYPFK